MPKSWIKKNNIKKGDIISLDEGTNQIIISTNQNESQKKDKEIIISAEDKKLQRIKAEIVSAYLSNYNTIELVSKKGIKNELEIKEILRNLAGVEILEQTSKRVIARDLINVHDISLKDLIRRMDNITRGMMEDCLECIKGNNCYESIFHRDSDVNRLNYLATRVISQGIKNPSVAKALGTDAFGLSSYYLIAMRIEKIADRQKRIARFLSQVKLRRKTLKDLRILYENIRKAYYDIMKAYYTSNKEVAFETEVLNKKRIMECESFLERNAGCANGRKNKKKRDDVSNLNCCVQLARIANNLSAMLTSIKYIGRSIMESDSF